MSVTVYCTHTSPPLQTFRQADEYMIDGHGNLILSTSRCGQVAVIAAGSWRSAKVNPNRDEHGRFAKRGA